MNIGNLCLSLALPASLFSLTAGRSRKATHLTTILLTLAVAMLAFAFVNDSFNLEYVQSYSSRVLPIIYKLTGLWAGLEGSLLFWAWLLSIFTTIVAVTTDDKTFPEINSILQAVVGFFLLMIIFQANPFAEISPVPPDGGGLNPLLQNAFMIFHPPALYIGYVAFSVPFAYAISALLRRDKSERWVKDVRLWTIIAWLFLTVGNLLGAMWAYVELGWGGFWGWDPVENAGIMPWFTATAFLHSIIIQQRRGMLRLWNISLVIATFLLTIVGTFITRSGIIRSVHSFSDVTIGIYFIVFLSAAIFISIYLIVTRRNQLKGKGTLDSLASREGSFYLNNVLLVLALFAIMWGTFLPLIADIFAGRKIEVGPLYFNRVMAPIGVALLFLTGIGPELSWRKMRSGLFKREFIWPVLASVAVAAATFALGVRKWFPLAAAAGAAFVVVSIFDEFVRGSIVEKGLIRLLRAAPRRYAGYIVHLGVALLFIGIAGSSYQKEFHLTLDKGVATPVAGYDLTLKKLGWIQKKDSEGIVANVDVSAEGKTLYDLKPALFLYANQPKPIAEIGLHIEPLKDVYIAMGGASESGTEAEFMLTINPLISFVWLGGLLMIVGTIFAIVPMLKRGEKDEGEALDIALGRADKEDFQ